MPASKIRWFRGTDCLPTFCHISAPWLLRPLPALPPRPPLHCCSVATACPTLCDPMDCSISDFPVLYYLSEFAQIHAHWVGDAIQPSHPLPSPSPPTLNLRVSIRVFSSESALYIRWPKYWSFSFSISPSNEYLGLTGLISLQSKGLSRVSSRTTVEKHQFFSAQPSLWPSFQTRTWLLENHSFDYMDFCQHCGHFTQTLSTPLFSL